MKNLPLHNLLNIDTLAQANIKMNVTEKTPALSVITDFEQHRALAIKNDVLAVDLEKLMKHAHVKMKLVVNNTNKFIGLITHYDLSEENIIKKVSKTSARNELTVKDFMHAKESLKCFDLHDLEGATVGDVLATQRKNHLQHCLIIDTQQQTIRGLISARDIARLISPNVDIEKHFSFESLYNELAYAS